MKNYNDLAYYEKFACISLYPEEAKKDEEGLIRLAAYRALGFPEEAKKDEDEDVRLNAYQALGFTEEAKQDENWLVRLEAYQALGFTEEAKQDQNRAIREEAELYFKVKNQEMIDIDGFKFSKDTIKAALTYYCIGRSEQKS